MAKQSLSYTPSLITDYIPYSNSFFARIVYADGIVPSFNVGSISIAVLNSQDITTANLVDTAVFKKEIQYFNACEVLFTSAVFAAGYLLKGYVKGLRKSAKIQIIEEGTAASGDIKFSANPVNNTTLTLGLVTAIGQTYVTYRFVNTLVQAYDVKIGTTAADTLDNLRRAINTAGVVNTNYAGGTLSNPIFSASITGSVLTYTDKIKCKRFEPYLISASSYTNIVIRTPIGGVDGSLLLEIPSSNSVISFKDTYVNYGYSFDYSFGKKETYSTIESVFIPLLASSAEAASSVFYSDDVNLNGFSEPAVVIQPASANIVTGQWLTDHYYLPSGSDRYSIIVGQANIDNSFPDPTINYISMPVDNIKFSLRLGFQNNICYFFSATVFY